MAKPLYLVDTTTLAHPCVSNFVPRFLFGRFSMLSWSLTYAEKVDLIWYVVE